jgi:hypothetical protein
MKPNELDALIDDCLEDRLSESDATRLSALLEQSAEARARYWQTASVHGLLEHSLQNASLRVVTGQALPTSPKINRWIMWRPLTAAAAGLVIGLFSASVVLAYVVPLARSMTLLDDSFEGSTALASKVSLEPGVWRGDHAEVVGAEHDVKPESGQRMLRFLREHFQGKPRPMGGHIADVYRLIDLREHRQEFINGGAVVQASASVNAMPFPESEKFGCAISIFALDAESLPESASYIGTALENEANAMARSSRTKLDRDPSSWQRLTTEMRLPANTEFLVVRLHINQLFESDDSSTFTGSYADDVRVVLTPRSPLP